MSPIDQYAFADIDVSAPIADLPSTRLSPQERDELRAKVRAYVARCQVCEFMGTRYVLHPNSTPRGTTSAAPPAAGDRSEAGDVIPLRVTRLATNA